jgi:hypothetical protein
LASLLQQLPERGTLQKIVDVRVCFKAHRFCRGAKGAGQYENLERAGKQLEPVYTSTCFLTEKACKFCSALNLNNELE